MQCLPCTSWGAQARKVLVSCVSRFDSPPNGVLRVSLHYLTECPILQGSCINSFAYSSFSSALVGDEPDEEDAESQEDESESVHRRVAFGCLKMAAGKWSHGPYGS